MFKIFHESPSRRTDYEFLTKALKFDNPLKFCSHRWVENEDVAKRAKAVWHKIVAITEFWVGLPKSKQPGLGQRGKNSSYDHFDNCYKDPLVPVKLRFFEEISKSLNKFLLVFQTDKPMAAFLIVTLEQLLGYFCSKFVKKAVMSKASTTSKLIKIDLNDENNIVSVTSLNLSFWHKVRIETAKKGKKAHWFTRI